ncbi:uncharacterized protein LOC107024613 isoform X3 [Solanum pennellii]|uniref:Uncharacterized protein LOC107024613 isoform X3 n=1 Tax=Solanum pennellii TaxID=28526 RepID=A0ABM1H6P2_SOLPN|nr:uncharacterized protein LOC107024613 isoform X3 [Solanum pennellii]
MQRMTKMTMAKIKLLRDKREVVLRQMRRYIGSDVTARIQSQPPTSASSSRLPPRQQLRLRDVKTLARLMGRLTEEEKRVILLLYNNNNNN